MHAYTHSLEKFQRTTSGSSGFSIPNFNIFSRKEWLARYNSTFCSENHPKPSHATNIRLVAITISASVFIGKCSGWLSDDCYKNTNFAQHTHAQAHFNKRRLKLRTINISYIQCYFSSFPAHLFRLRAYLHRQHTDVSGMYARARN